MPIYIDVNNREGAGARKETRGQLRGQQGENEGQ